MARPSQTARGGSRSSNKQTTSKFARMRKSAKSGRKGEDDDFDFPGHEALRLRIRRNQIMMDRRRVESKWRPKIPEVRKVDFENFKNHYYDPSQPDYAIEALMTSNHLTAQVRHEQASRRKEESARYRAEYMAVYGHSPALYMGMTSTNSKKFKRNPMGSAAAAENAEIHRVRIQSQAVLGHLTDMLGVSTARSTPRTFVRPFKPFVYFQPKMKEILATLEEKWGDVEDLESESAGEIMTPPQEPDAFKQALDKKNAEAEEGKEGEAKDEFDEDSESLASVDSEADQDQEIIMDSVEALRDMRCYVDFVDREIMPMYSRFDGCSASKVRYEDLWSLFRVGDVIYQPTTGDVAGRYHGLWKIEKIDTPKIDVESFYPRTSFSIFGDEFEGRDSDKAFAIYGYYIDHDGSSYGAVRHKFEIEPFEGKRSIDSLEVFPVRYHEDHETMLALHRDQGRDFQRYLKPSDRHQLYNAWTLIRNPPEDNDEPESELLRDERGETMRHPEFIESDIIIDMTEAYQRNPDWRPSFYQPSVSKGNRSSTADDKMDIHHWFDASRTQLAFECQEVVQTIDGIELRQRRQNLTSDRFLAARAKGNRSYNKKNAKEEDVMELREDDLVLLPKRMFAYALRDRRFIPIDLTAVRPIRREQGIFESLRISNDYKDIVRGLVSSHFQKKSLERRYAAIPAEGPGQDLIQGKGRGLVVLLHGVPGVGKTATAEAVAAENQKPLFVITCGDLGLSPSEVESSLIKVFRLAHLWDCVLLLDEADVFLTQRSHDDMKRNALVSVFLRVLEYYNGLLFLTTNRVGAIDEAFKSRIHMSLYYPPLDKAQTRDIFRLNVAKLRQIEEQRHYMTGAPPIAIREDQVLQFAERHFDDHARLGCWNGRQIRNAFQIAAGLAHHEYNTEREAASRRGTQPTREQPVLDRALFEKVQMSTQSFERHMLKENGRVELPMRDSFAA